MPDPLRPTLDDLLHRVDLAALHQAQAAQAYRVLFDAEQAWRTAPSEENGKALTVAYLNYLTALANLKQGRG